MSRPVRATGAAVVTGAGGGLGAAIATALASRGYTVHCTDIDGAAAQAVADRIGGRASTLDVRDEPACRAVAQDTGDLRVWVNNAGILVTGPAWRQDAATRRAVLEINALGTMNGTMAALATMVPNNRGHVVNIASLAGLVPAPGETVYAASKHAVLAFSVGMLADLRTDGVDGVDISCVCPDGMWTPMLHDRLDDPTAAASFTGQLLRPEEVAAVVLRTLDRPRPVRAVPRWRGGQVRLLAAAPRLAVRGVGLVLRYGRWRQRRYARLIAAGRWP